MEQSYAVNKTFDRVNFEDSPIANGEYENCIFKNCNFSNSNLSGVKFIECQFNECNLSMSKLTGTLFRDVQFKDCKMLGLRFDTCSDFGLSFSFENCTLNHSTFYKKKIKNKNVNR